MSKMRKGYVLTIDAVLALMFVMALLLYTVGVGMNNSIGNTERTDFKTLHFISEDAIEVLNKKGVLDDIGTEWANSGGDNSPTSVHWSNASNISKFYLSQIIPDRMGYRLMIGNDCERFERGPRELALLKGIVLKKKGEILRRPESPLSGHPDQIDATPGIKRLQFFEKLDNIVLRAKMLGQRCLIERL